MRKRKFRPGNNTPLAQPLFRAWTPKPGDRLEGVRREYREGEFSSLDPAYLVPFHYRLEPKYVAGFFVVPPLSESEVERIEKGLGTPLNPEALLGLNDALGRLVAGIGLAPRVPPLRAFAERLREVVTAGDYLLSIAGSAEGSGRRSGVLTADESIRHFLRYVGFPEEQLRNLVETCRHELAELEPLASRSGRRGYTSLHLFLESLILIARSLGVPIRIPSNAGYEEYGWCRIVLCWNWAEWPPGW